MHTLGRAGGHSLSSGQVHAESLMSCSPLLPQARLCSSTQQLYKSSAVCRAAQSLHFPSGPASTSGSPGLTPLRSIQMYRRHRDPSITSYPPADPSSSKAHHPPSPTQNTSQQHGNSSDSDNLPAPVQLLQRHTTSPPPRPGPLKSVTTDWVPPSAPRRNQVTTQIVKATTVSDLLAIMAREQKELNAIHACTLLSRLAGLCQRNTLEPHDMRLLGTSLPQVLALVKSKLPDMGARALSNTAYSLGRLQLFDKECLSILSHHVERHWAETTPQGLANMIWGFARLGYQPSVKWVDVFLANCLRRLKEFRPIEISTLLWSLAKLNYKMVPAKLQQFLGQMQADVDNYQPQALSNVLFALARTDQQPGTQFLTAVEGRMQRLRAEDFTPQCITQLCWALARMRHRPGLGLLTQLEEHMALMLDTQYEAIDVATALYVLASFGHHVPRTLRGQLMRRSRSLLSSMGANQLANTAWALGRLQHAPSADWYLSFFTWTYEKLPVFKPLDLSMTVWGLARLDAPLPRAWLEAVLLRVEASASMFTPTEIANTVWALARLQSQSTLQAGRAHVSMPRTLMLQFFLATDRRLSHFQPRELCTIIWALAKMNQCPDKEWTEEFLKATFHKVASMDAQGLGNVIWALAELHMQPTPAWLYNYVNVCSRELGSLQAQDLGQVIQGLRRINLAQGPEHSLQKVDDFIAAAVARLTELEVQSSEYSKVQLKHFAGLRPAQAQLRTSLSSSSQPPPATHMDHTLSALDLQALQHGAESGGSSTSSSCSSTSSSSSGGNGDGNGHHKGPLHIGNANGVVLHPSRNHDGTITLQTPYEMHIEVGDMCLDFVLPSGPPAHAIAIASGSSPPTIQTGKSMAVA